MLCVQSLSSGLTSDMLLNRMNIEDKYEFQILLMLRVLFWTQFETKPVLLRRVIKMT